MSHLLLSFFGSKLAKTQGFGCDCKMKSSYILVTARSSGILIGKQKLGRTFNSDKLGGIAFTTISKLTMCSA